MDRRSFLQFATAGLASAQFSGGTAAGQEATKEIFKKIYEDQFHSYLNEEAGRFEVRSIELALHQDMVPMDRSLAVFADTIILDTRVSVIGPNSIFLIARQFICSGEAELSTRGAHGSPSYTGTSADLGQDGASDTGHGSNGGDIVIYAGIITGTLTIDASGGTGGDAQSGGKGATGAAGDITAPDQFARSGKTGGAGGRAGTPGNGGNTGKVTVNTASEPEPNSYTIQINSKAGAAGHPGRHGDPGDGGPPAPAQNGVTVITSPCLQGPV